MKILLLGKKRNQCLVYDSEHLSSSSYSVCHSIIDPSDRFSVLFREAFQLNGSFE